MFMVPVSIISLDLMLVKIGPQDGEVGIQEASSRLHKGTGGLAES